MALVPGRATYADRGALSKRCVPGDDFKCPARVGGVQRADPDNCSSNHYFAADQRAFVSATNVRDVAEAMVLFASAVRHTPELVYARFGCCMVRYCGLIPCVDRL